MTNQRALLSPRVREVSHAGLQEEQFTCKADRRREITKPFLMGGCIQKVTYLWNIELITSCITRENFIQQLTLIKSCSLISSEKTRDVTDHSKWAPLSPSTAHRTQLKYLSKDCSG